MNEIDLIRTLIAEDEDGLYALNILAELLVSAEANAVRLESMRSVTDARQLQGTVCPYCRRARGHNDTCYLRSGTGFDLLIEHEATLRENDELRRALAPHLGETAQKILTGDNYTSMRTRLRRRATKKGGGSTG